MKQLKIIDTLKDQVKHNEEEIDSNLDSIIDGFMNTDIGNIAQEVSKNLNIEEMFEGKEDSNPIEVMSELFNPENMNKIFKNISEVIEEKKKSGFNEDSMKQQAEGMFKKMSGDKLFQNTMNEMHKNFNIPVDQNQQELSQEKKQELLREKIKQKKEQRTKQ